MRPLDDMAEPTVVDLRAIDAEADLLAAELALVDAECAWFSRPGPISAADYLRALAALADLHDKPHPRSVGAVA